MEASGLTSPDKHDIVLVKFGRRVRIAETRQGKAGRVEIQFDETTLAKVEQMFRTLPDDHNLGLVNVITGAGSIPSVFIAFLKKQAERKGFAPVTTTAPRPLKDVFDGFYDALGGGATQGTA